MMGLLDSVLGSALGGLTGGQGGGANPLLQVLVSLMTSQGGAAGGGGGGLGGLLGGALGSALGGGGGAAGAAGGLGGLGALLGQLTQGGLGEQVQPWVGTGANLPVSPDQLSAALGSDRLGQLAQQVGLNPGDLAGQLSHMLPQVVDKLTPQGQVPADGGVGDLGNVLGGLLGQLGGR